MTLKVRQNLLTVGTISLWDYSLLAGVEEPHGFLAVGYFHKERGSAELGVRISCGEAICFE